MRWPPLTTAASLIVVAITALVVLVRHEPLAPHPAQAEESGAATAPVIGEVPREGLVTLIENSGTYGLGIGPSGSRYAVVGGFLVRIDLQTGKIVSILRALPQAPR